MQFLWTVILTFLAGTTPGLAFDEIKSTAVTPAPIFQSRFYRVPIQSESECGQSLHDFLSLLSATNLQKSGGHLNEEQLNFLKAKLASLPHPENTSPLARPRKRPPPNPDLPPNQYLNAIAEFLAVVPEPWVLAYTTAVRFAGKGEMMFSWDEMSSLSRGSWESVAEPFGPNDVDGVRKLSRIINLEAEISKHMDQYESDGDYVSRRLLSRLHAYGKAKKDLRFFCETYAQEQSTDRGVGQLSGIIRFYTPEHWRLATGDGLTEGELALLLAYQHVSRVNQLLYSGSPLNEKDRLVVEKLRAALKKLPPFRGPVIRYASMPAQVLAAHTRGNVVTYPAFTSTSADLDWKGMASGNDKLEITLTGTHCHDISNISKYPEEKEVLCEPGVRFNVLGRRSDPLNPGHLLMRMEEVH